MISLSHWGMYPVLHWSDCATYNEPAFPNGPCNCGGFLDHSEFEPPARGYNFTRDEPQLSYDAKYLHG